MNHKLTKTLILSIALFLCCVKISNAQSSPCSNLSAVDAKCCRAWDLRKTKTEANMKKAFSMASECAKEGSGSAMYLLSLMYKYGDAIEASDKMHVYWLNKSVEADYAMAQYWLGRLCLAGKLVERDTPKALDLLKKAADQNLPQACEFLGEMYLYGRNCSKDSVQGMKYIKIAAERNRKRAQKILVDFIVHEPNATKTTIERDLKKQITAGNIHAYYGLGQFYLRNKENEKAKEVLVQGVANKCDYCAASMGRLYFKGEVVKKDCTKAFRYFSKAAKQQNPLAAYYLGILYMSGQVCDKDSIAGVSYFRQAAKQKHCGAMYKIAVLNEKKKENRQESIVLLDECIKRKFPPAYARLARHYLFGLGVERDLDKVYQLLEKGSEMGDVAAMQYFAYFMLDKKYKHFDAERALKLVTMALEKNPQNIYSKIILGDCYRKGAEGEKGYNKALSIFEELSDTGCSSGDYFLSLMYRYGNGVEIDYEKSYQYALHAAQAGDAGGMYTTAYMYYTGQGVQQDYKKAVEWLRKGVDKNRSSCMYLLGLCYRNGYGVERNEDLGRDWIEKSGKRYYVLAKDELNTTLPENSFEWADEDGMWDSKPSFQDIKKSAFPIDILGLWEGERIVYDYSGKIVIGKQNIKLQLTQQNGEIKGVWTENDSTIMQMVGVVIHNELILSSGRAERYNYKGIKLKLDMQQINFQSEYFNGKPGLTGDVTEFVSNWHEPNQPVSLRLIQTKVINEQASISTQLPSVDVQQTASVNNEDVSSEDLSGQTLLYPSKNKDASIKKSIVCFPNPFTDHVRIEYVVPSEGNITVALYNMKGQMVETIKDENQAQGKYTIMAGQALPVGSYLVSVRHKGQLLYRNQIVIKRLDVISN